MQSGTGALAASITAEVSAESDAVMATVGSSGVKYTDGTMLEAKHNYEFLFDDSGNWLPWVANPESPLKQMLSQSAAAALDGRLVEWHASQKGYAIFLERVMAGARITNISVIYDPGP